jgi:signal transduction histidine kinase
VSATQSLATGPDWGRADEWHRIIESLLDLVAAVNSERSLDDILDEVLVKASAVLGSNGAAVYLRDRDDPDRLSVRACRDLPPEATMTRARVGYPIVGLAVSSQQPVVVMDFPTVLTRPRAETVEEQVIQRDAWLEVMRPGPASAMDAVQSARNQLVAGQFRTILAMPLATSRESYGTLALYYTAAQTPTTSGIHLLSAFASHAALAIENAQLHRQATQRLVEIDRRRRVAEGMRELVAVLNSSRSIDEILDFAMNQADKLLGAAACALYLVDPLDPEAFVIRVMHGFGAAAPESRVPARVPPVGLVATRGRPISCVDLLAALDRDAVGTVEEQLEERGSHLELMRPGPASTLTPELPARYRRTAERFRANLSVPLPGEPSGVISLYFHEPRTFEDEDVGLANAFAAQVAAALETARLRAETEQRTRDVEALYRADDLLHRSLQLEDVLGALIDVSMDILQADKASVMVWDAQHEHLVPGALRGFSAESAQRMSYAPGEGITGRVAQSGQSIFVEDTRNDDRVAHKIVDPEGIISVAHVPITMDGEVFGVFSIGYTWQRRFTASDERLLMVLAGKAAIAIENARLYGRAQHAAALEERQRLARELHDAVTQTLFSASLIAEVLPQLMARDPDEGQRRAAELRQLTRGALAEMRNLLLELRPGALTEVALEELLRQLVDATASRSRATIKLQLSGRVGALASDVQIALYRLVQESLANIIKHAHATSASVSLHADAEGIRICVEDDGRGFDPAVVVPGHLGLAVMRERATSIGASLRIESQPGAGSKVTITWPESACVLE